MAGLNVLDFEVSANSLLWCSCVFTFLLPALTTANADVTTYPNSAVRMGRQKWCPWSEWSRCAPVACQNEIRPGPAFSFEPQSGDSEEENSSLASDELATYCVVEPTIKSRKALWTAVVHFTSDGITRSRTPIKQRVRSCKCPSFSILNIMAFLTRDQCKRDSEEVQCATCAADELIFTELKPSDGSQPLPFCDPYSQSAFRLYKILGGVAGGVVLILFIVWLIRILYRVMSRSNRVAGRRSSSDVNADLRPCRAGVRRISRGRNGAGTGGGRTTDPSSHVRVGLPDDDLPPAYKDVVDVVPRVSVVNPLENIGAGGDDSLHRIFRVLHKPPRVSQSLRPFPQASADAIDPNNTSGQHFDSTMPPSNTPPPPPSYEDIVAGGLCILDISSRVTAAGGGGGGNGDEQHPETPVSSGQNGGGGGGGGNGAMETTVRVLIPTAPPPES